MSNGGSIVQLENSFSYQNATDSYSGKAKIQGDNSKNGSIYPGDLVVYKSKHPWDWSPTYGTVVVHRDDGFGDPLKREAATPKISFTNEMGRYNAFTRSSVVSTAAAKRSISSASGTPKSTDNVEDANEPSVTVHWDSSNRLRQMKRSEVSIVDRMVVRGTRVKGVDGSSGTVINYNVKATLQIVGTNDVIQNVQLADLRPISPLVRGQEILYKRWIGIITNVKRKVWFRLDGGLKFHIETMESDGFMKTDPYWGLGVACPGVRVPISSGVLKSAKWDSKYMKFLWRWLPPLPFLYSFSSATVTKVEISSVSVKWLAPAPNSSAVQAIPPSNTLDMTHAQDVQILSMPSSEYAGLNSIRMYALKPEDRRITYGAWFSQFRHRFMEDVKHRSHSDFSSPPSKPVGATSVTEVPVKILLRHNYCDVLWDDGKKERIPAIDIPIIYEPKCYETLPTGMVVSSELSPPDSKRYGIIQISEELVESGSNTVRVHWFCEGNHRERVVQDEGVTEESIFTLHPHPKFSLFQRETILFSVDPDLHEFNAGVVIDVDVRQGNMITFCTDGRYRKVWPHMVIPFPKRCTWNFFTRKWVVDDIIPPPHQLGLDYYPKNVKLSSREVDEALVILKEKFKHRELWEDPPFDLLDHAPQCHAYYKPNTEHVDAELIKIIKGEFDLIRSTTPEGVWIRVYEDRMDLVSVMIAGPSGTPYENGLFFFDMRLPKNFPKSAPRVHFISYGGEIHPLLAEDGNFCEANLKWKYDPSEGALLQPKSYIVEAVKAIQGLLYATQPYYADGLKSSENAGAEDAERSRSYNEMVYLRVLGSYCQAAVKPHEPWQRHIADHVISTLQAKVEQAERLLSPEAAAEAATSTQQGSSSKLPSYPLLPVSKGFKIALDSSLKNMRAVLNAILPEPETSQETPKTEETVTITKQKPSADALQTTLEELMHEHKWQLKPVDEQKTDDVITKSEEIEDVGIFLADL